MRRKKLLFFSQRASKLSDIRQTITAFFEMLCDPILPASDFI